MKNSKILIISLMTVGLLSVTGIGYVFGNQVYLSSSVSSTPQPLASSEPFASEEPIVELIPSPSLLPETSPTTLATQKPTSKPTPKPSPSPSPSGTPDPNAPQKPALSYTLSPGHNPQRVRVDQYPDSDYAYVILRNQDGHIIKDQSNVTYDWQVGNGAMVEYNLSRAPNTPCYPLANDIQQPCPPFSAYLKGHFPGETTITVTASIPGKGIVGRTQFQVITYENK